VTTLIIGASGAVGAGIAKRLLQGKWDLVLTSRHSSSRADPGLADLAGCCWMDLDVTNEAQTETVIAEVGRRSGNRFNLIYCAGRMNDRPLLQLTSEDWNQVTSVNLDGAFFAIRAAFQKLAVGRTGRIVLIGSISATHAQFGQAAYSASKAGLEALCRVAALELGRFGVTCNVLAAGALDDGMMSQVKPQVAQTISARTPLRRLGTVAEVAGAVEFLLGPSAGHITGQTIVMDGGFSAT
jgi:NAD(P)-dependent dehydrogenase (short-subunit alcohol dehydrogenase family)